MLRMLTVIIATLGLALISSANATAKDAAKKPQATAKPRSFEECQKRAQQLGLPGRVPSSNSSASGSTFMTQCLAGKI